MTSNTAGFFGVYAMFQKYRRKSRQELFLGPAHDHPRGWSCNPRLEPRSALLLHASALKQPTKVVFYSDNKPVASTVIPAGDNLKAVLHFSTDAGEVISVCLSDLVSRYRGECFGKLMPSGLICALRHDE